MGKDREGRKEAMTNTVRMSTEREDFAALHENQARWLQSYHKGPQFLLVKISCTGIREHPLTRTPKTRILEGQEPLHVKNNASQRTKTAR